MSYQVKTLTVCHGLTIDHKVFVESRYEIYTEKENGYRDLVTDRLYDSRNNKLLTEDEARIREERGNKIALEILSELGI